MNTLSSAIKVSHSTVYATCRNIRLSLTFYIRDLRRHLQFAQLELASQEILSLLTKVIFSDSHAIIVDNLSELGRLNVRFGSSLCTPLKYIYPVSSLERI